MLFLQNTDSKPLFLVNSLIRIRMYSRSSGVRNQACEIQIKLSTASAEKSEHDGGRVNRHQSVAKTIDNSSHRRGMHMIIKRRSVNDSRGRWDSPRD